MPAPTAPPAALDYRALFQLLPDNYLLLTPDGTILDNTDRHMHMSMLPREQAAGKNIFVAYPTADAQSQADLDASHEQVRRTRLPHAMPLLRYDIERPAAQGGGLEERYWQITHFPLLDASGELQYILQQSQDVTETMRAAQRAAQTQLDLSESQARSAFILGTLPIMVWTADGDGVLTSFNHRWLSYTGRALADTIGEGWATDLHPDDLPRTAAIWQQALQTSTAYQAEYRLRRHDGAYRWSLAQATPQLAADGRVRMWVGCNTDIEAQKQLVAELLETAERQAQLSEQAYQGFEEAQQQRETLRNLLLQAPAMISIVRGPEHRYEFVNPPYQTLFPGRELLGRTVAETAPEVVGQGFIEILDEVLRTGQTYHGHEQRALLDRRGDGQPEEVYFNFIYQQFSENGAPAGITTFAQEVTELVRARKLLAAVPGSAGPAAPG